MRVIIALLFVALNANVFAQKVVTEGVVKTKMTLTSENKDVNAQLSLMGDMIMTTHFKGGSSKSEMKNPMTGNSTTIVNEDSKKILTLLDTPYLGKKFNEQELKISKEDLEKIKITENGKTKTIAGYKCKGYDIVVNVEGKEKKMTYYTTDKITAITQNNAMLGDKFIGFPMMIVSNITQDNMIMTMTMEVTEVKSEKVDETLFKIVIPEDYTKM